MSLLEGMLHPVVGSVALIASIVVFALGIVLVPWLVTRVPADYFIRTPRAASRSRAADVTLVVVRNAGGVLLVAAGILMLVLPGQGILTIVAGLSLLSFPGKRKLELRVLRTPAIRRSIDRMRRRAGKPPLRLEPAAHEDGPASTASP